MKTAEKEIKVGDYGYCYDVAGNYNFGRLQEIVKSRNGVLYRVCGWLWKHFEPTDEYDYCVKCGAKSDFAKGENINHRYGYIEGVGQLCTNCYWRLQDKWQ